MKLKRVWLMCGPAGSGKSTWIQKQIKTNPGVWCSRDNIRFSMVNEDEEYFSKENEVFKSWISSIQVAIADISIENIYIDATHLNDNSRNKVLNQLNLNNIELYAVNFLTPLKECLRRNDLREGRSKVPRSVIRRMYYQFVPVDLEDKRYTKVINI